MPTRKQQLALARQGAAAAVSAWERTLAEAAELLARTPFGVGDYRNGAKIAALKAFRHARTQAHNAKVRLRRAQAEERDFLENHEQALRRARVERRKAMAAE